MGIEETDGDDKRCNVYGMQLQWDTNLSKYFWKIIVKLSQRKHIAV